MAKKNPVTNAVRNKVSVANNSIINAVNAAVKGAQGAANKPKTPSQKTGSTSATVGARTGVSGGGTSKNVRTTAATSAAAGVPPSKNITTTATASSAAGVPPTPTASKYTNTNSGSSRRNSSGNKGTTTSSISSGNISTNTQNQNVTSTKKTPLKNPNIVNTNSSWKGDYLSVDLNTDYKALQNEAERRGDLVQAANYEALRNAKINYLNANSMNGNNYDTTNEYVRRTATNNQNGASYDPNNTVSNSGAGTFTLNGHNYRRDANGNIYGVSGRQADGTVNEYLVGDGYNADTGEFTFNNPEAAKNMYVQQMIGAGVLPKGSTYEDAAAAGLVDDLYVGSLMSGDVAAYTDYMQRTGRTNYSPPTVVYDEDEDVEIPAEAVNNNSFENDFYNDDYWNSRVMGWNRYF